jgi:aminoglycoside 3-N-acetyltransferase
MRRTSKAELIAVLERLQLPRDHVYVVHSSLLKFGLFEHGLPGVMACLWQVLGADATLLMPSFTFSYGRTRQWDWQRSRAETGALCEHFRRLPGTLRTLHPFHSLAVAGPRAAAFAACDGLSSFGAGSPFALLHELSAINIGLGTDFEGGATFLHHGEEVAQVPYRYYQDFPGRVLDAQGLAVAQTFRMYVRRADASCRWENRWAPVWDDLVQADLVRRERLHGAQVFAMAVRPVHDWFVARLKADPLYCAHQQWLQATDPTQPNEHEESVT